METNLKIFKDITLQEDLDLIVNSDIPFEKLRNTNVLITGATGLIGVSLVRTLLYLNRKKNMKIKVLALVRNKNKAKKIYGDLLKYPDLDLVISDITDKLDLKQNVDYIFHCAGVTTSKTMINQPVETLMISVLGTKNLLDLAVSKRVKSIVYLSSMEMYGSFSNLDHDVSEKDLGYIDPLNIRSNYPESKRLCENMCIAYLAEYNVPVKIARLAQTFGAGILPEENRVFAQFARSAINGENIILHTYGKSEGNYCYIRDAIKGLFIILIKGQDGEAYNVSNPKTHTTIVDMAEMVCEEFTDGKSKVLFDVPEGNYFGYAADTKIKLDSEKLQLLGWIPEVDLKEAYKRLISSLKNEK